MNYVKNAIWSWWLGAKETDARKRLMTALEQFEMTQVQRIKDALDERDTFYGGEAVSIAIEPVGFSVVAKGLDGLPRSTIIAFVELTEGSYNPLQRAVERMALSIGLQRRPEEVEP